MEQCNQNYSGIIRFNKLFSLNGLVYFKLWMYVNVSVRKNQFEQEKNKDFYGCVLEFLWIG